MRDQNNAKLACKAVLFDAPQIPAGMHPFRRIPPDSTGIEPEYTGMALE